MLEVCVQGGVCVCLVCPLSRGGWARADSQSQRARGAGVGAERVRAGRAGGGARRGRKARACPTPSSLNRDTQPRCVPTRPAGSRRQCGCVSACARARPLPPAISSNARRSLDGGAPLSPLPPICLGPPPRPPGPATWPPDPARPWTVGLSPPLGRGRALDRAPRGDGRGWARGVEARPAPFRKKTRCFLPSPMRGPLPCRPTLGPARPWRPPWASLASCLSPEWLGWEVRWGLRPPTGQGGRQKKRGGAGAGARGGAAAPAAASGGGDCRAFPPPRPACPTPVTHAPRPPHPRLAHSPKPRP